MLPAEAERRPARHQHCQLRARPDEGGYRGRAVSRCSKLSRTNSIRLFRRCRSKVCCGGSPANSLIPSVWARTEGNSVASRRGARDTKPNLLVFPAEEPQAAGYSLALWILGRRVASLGLVGRQVAVLRPHAARLSRNERILLLSEGLVCASGY